MSDLDCGLSYDAESIGLDPIEWRGLTLDEFSQLGLLVKILSPAKGKARETLVEALRLWCLPESENSPLTLEHALAFVQAIEEEASKRLTFRAANELISSGEEDLQP